MANDATAVTRDEIGENSEALPQAAQGRVLVLFRQATEPHHISVQDCRELSRKCFRALGHQTLCISPAISGSPKLCWLCEMKLYAGTDMDAKTCG